MEKWFAFGFRSFIVVFKVTTAITTALATRYSAPVDILFTVLADRTLDSIRAFTSLCV